MESIEVDGDSEFDLEEASALPRYFTVIGTAAMALLFSGLGLLAYHSLGDIGPDPLTSDPLPGGSPTNPSASTSLPPADPRPAVSSTGSPGLQPLPGGLPSVLAQSCLARLDAEIPSPADPSNYGARQASDWRGQPVPSTPSLIVLHETVVDEAGALSLFRSRHSDDGQQASYHLLIGRDGRRIRVVSDEQRAYGAGDSAWNGLAVQLREAVKPSVNNFALHLSLVSPPDGADGEARRHSGYTAEQYRSLANQIALWQSSYAIPGTRVVTHQEVDRSNSRRDPRSFDWRRLAAELNQRLQACGAPAQMADLGRSAASMPSR